MERLQPRGELPPVPSLDPGGDPDVWRHSEPVVLGPAAGQMVDKELQELDGGLLAKAREEHPEWYAQDWEQE